TSTASRALRSSPAGLAASTACAWDASDTIRPPPDPRTTLPLTPPALRGRRPASSSAALPLQPRNGAVRGTGRGAGLPHGPGRGAHRLSGAAVGPGAPAEPPPPSRGTAAAPMPPGGADRRGARTDGPGRPPPPHTAPESRG